MAQNFIYKPNCSITEFNHRTQRLQLQQQIQKQILKPRTYFNTDRSNIVSNDKLQEHIAAELHADDDMSAVYHCGQLTSVFDSIKWSPLGNNQTNDSNIKNTSNTSILSIKHCAHTTVYLDIPRPPSIPTASLIRNTPPSLLLSRLSPNYYSTCCSLTYNMFAAYAEAVTLQMKCKTHFNRLLHVGGHLDMRSLRYLILMVLVYWSVLTHVAVATNVTTTTAQPFLLPLLPSLTSHNDSFVQQSLTAFDSQHVSSLRNFTFTFTVSGTMSTSLSNQTSKSLVTYDASMNNFAFNLRSLTRRDAANVPDPDAEDDDSSYHDEEFDEYEALIHNKSAKGKYIGAPCNNMKCETSLVHVTCEKETLTCGCEKNYPVQLGLTRGCDKPKKLGEQCFYDETCQYNDENSLCVQVRHNALCQCASGFHSVSYTKPTRRVFCTQDLDELNSDLPTLLGVCLGIGVLAGLICMVLHLFSKTKYPRHRNFGDANLPPPIMYSSETVQSGRPSSRSSIRSSGGSVGSYGNRRTSSVGGTTGTGASKGILVSTSRTGAARSAAILLISCHLSAISKQNSRVSSRQTSGAGCSANSRDNLDENGSNPDSRSCDSTLSMTRHLQKQLNHQRHLLSFELSPAKTKNHDRVRALLGLNGIDNYRTDDDDFNSLENGGGNHLEIGALPTPASETPCFAVKLLDKTKLNQLNKQISIYCPHQTYKQKTEKKSKQHEQQHTTLHFLMKFAT